jgi:hypothetical protein
MLELEIGGNNMSQVYIKSNFTGWRLSDYNTALIWAKTMILMMTMGDDNYRLDLINNRLKGVQFTLQQLKNESEINIHQQRSLFS